MSPETFRRLALELPEVEERAHMGHPDFRVRGRIFASLAVPSEEWATLALGSDHQEVLVKSHPEVFSPAAGAWGARGWTRVLLRAARVPVLREALREAWRGAAGRPTRPGGVARRRRTLR
jgi:hypothetical protein